MYRGNQEHKMDAIVLVGVLCFFNCADGKTKDPVVIGPPYETMEKCEAFRTKITDKADPADWIDAKLRCVVVRTPDI